MESVQKIRKFEQSLDGSSLPEIEGINYKTTIDNYAAGTDGMYTFGGSFKTPTNPIFAPENFTVKPLSINPPYSMGALGGTLGPSCPNKIETGTKYIVPRDSLKPLIDGIKDIHETYTKDRYGNPIDGHLTMKNENETYRFPLGPQIITPKKQFDNFQIGMANSEIDIDAVLVAYRLRKIFDKIE